MNCIKLKIIRLHETWYPLKQFMSKKTNRVEWTIDKLIVNFFISLMAVFSIIGLVTDA